MHLLSLSGLKYWINLYLAGVSRNDWNYAARVLLSFDDWNANVEFAVLLLLLLRVDVLIIVIIIITKQLHTDRPSEWVYFETEFVQSGEKQPHNHRYWQSSVNLRRHSVSKCGLNIWNHLKIIWWQVMTLYNERTIKN